MNFEVQVKCIVYVDGLRQEGDFILRPDKNINRQFKEPFNWVGQIMVRGQLKEVLVAQKSIHDKPRPEDVILPSGVYGINEHQICKQIIDAMVLYLN